MFFGKISCKKEAKEGSRGKRLLKHYWGEVRAPLYILSNTGKTVHSVFGPTSAKLPNYARGHVLLDPGSL